MEGKLWAGGGLTEKGKFLEYTETRERQSEAVSEYEPVREGDDAGSTRSLGECNAMCVYVLS